MAPLAKSFSTLIVLALTAYLSMAQPASAISVELAKKCRAMAIKAHPTQIAGALERPLSADENHQHAKSS
jgi:hypothetical protein